MQFSPYVPSINDVTHLGGRGNLPKGDVTPSAYLVKWVTRYQKFQKMGDVTYGRPLYLNFLQQSILRYVSYNGN